MSEKSVELQAEGILLICFFCSLSIIKIKYKVYFNLGLFISQLLILLIHYKDGAIAYYTIFQSCMTFIVQYHFFCQDLDCYVAFGIVDVTQRNPAQEAKNFVDDMISNKLESNGGRGNVQVSEETKQLLEKSYPDHLLSNIQYKFINVLQDLFEYYFKIYFLRLF
ncbi:unnamed protein product (macronuclear) [Paramecium tetraurelia]|uniref:Uncharacterized protein n=1 Tax=Paramecium tetraurelia TaxID=5888 RepID=A0BG78_PARTE|nr:uncharacterized protein GSPATT00028580001 [Paramecium tetraurelia]CAK57545.1 unnamed protein product [Paramecium tetraurelia]|eukprot:XP_001424943.1 hypothetical protein (macronuclear) [Paramecium tetraurelia strain d4-2]